MQKTALFLALLATLAAASPTRALRDYQAADQELNLTYQTLTRTIGMPAATKQKLVAAQLAWIKFRDADAALALAFADGTAAEKEEERLERLRELTEARTKELREIIDDANGD